MMFIAVFLIAVLGGAVQAVTGFGAGIVMMLVLPHFFGLITAPALSSAIALALNSSLAFRFRRYIRWNLVLLPALMYTVASVTTIRMVGGLNLDILELAFGIFLVCLSVHFTAFSKRVSVKATPVSASVCALVSGICSGLFGIGGPLMAIYFLAATEGKEEYVGCSQFVFSSTSVVNLLMRLHMGIYTLDMVPMTLLGMVAITLGKLGGLRILERLNTDVLKKIIYIFVGISGVLTILR